jgi:3-phosphoshikimate 1-carboxyvinyltransferase
LLLAYAAAGASGVAIKVRELKSRPYIDLTLDVMKQFGLKLPENRAYESFYFGPGEIPPADGVRNYQVEGDWSGAAFLLVASALAGPVTVSGLDLDSPQADKAILDALRDAGAGLEFRDDGIRVSPGQLQAFGFDATDCPDLFPPLVALAAYCRGMSILRGVGRLAHKESNRALTLQEEFGKMGVEIVLQGDNMLVHGGNPLQGARLHSHHDHRIAMAGAVAALAADGPSEILEAEAISKSYPDFYEHLKKLGAGVYLPTDITKQ